MTSKKSSVFKYLIYVAIAAVMIFWVVKKSDFQRVVEDIKNANYFWVVLAAFVGLFGHFIRAYRWKMLIEPLGYKSKLSSSFYSVMIGYMVNYGAPRVGEVLRCAIKGRSDDIPVDKLLGTVITERVFDLIVTVLITVLAIAVQYDLIGTFLAEQFAANQSDGIFKIVILGGLVLSGIVGWIIFTQIRKRKLNNPIIAKAVGIVERLIDGAKSIFHMKRPLVFIVLTLGIWVMYFGVAYLIFFAVDGTSHLGVNAALTALVMSAVAVIIPAPGGLGSFHYFVPLGLGLYGIDANTTGTSYAAISHGSQMLMIMIVGLISFVMVSFEKKKAKLNVSAEGDRV